jgi:hypothetical protein
LSSTARPFGVKALTLLQVLLGILTLLGGVVLLSVGLVLPEMFPHVRFFGRSLALGFALLVLALIDFILAYGLWKGKRWAWVATLVFGVLGIVLAVLSLSTGPRVGEFVSLILNLLILYYLIQPRVQAYFGRGPSAANRPKASN